VGNVILPNDILNGQGTVDIQQANIDGNVDSTGVISQVVSVTLFDANGNAISGLTDNVELCLSVNVTDENGAACLAYLDETVDPPEWKCVDDCLEQKGDQLCGTTDHFTNFAVLIGGNTGSGSSDDPCSGEDTTDADKTYLWLSLAAVLIAIVLCCIIIPVGEVWRRIERKKRKQDIRKRQSYRRSQYLAANRSKPGSSGGHSDSTHQALSQSRIDDDDMQVLV
jgi:hypothetical protein